MEVVVVVAIGILATIFVASVLGLLVVCHHKYCKPRDPISEQHLQQNDPDVNLVDNMEGDQTDLPSGVLELDHVTPSDLETILQNKEWVNDATALMRSFSAFRNFYPSQINNCVTVISCDNLYY
ncbi:hypothetical protein CAPTEDRAFT_185141 [Capitella teleta]|uniref:Transmembrane protein 98 n=1 Tax=Capitella teleta TaxID=283909 RepID=R7TPW1_CAPTE|nr:hypothetical protein CAPTEDRAFT_185141 [Capitella teleta]|eukprot:ELT93080.1 hypothetical protein CAPTEDRAFT_185141 [Capitella teleta]